MPARFILPLLVLLCAGCSNGSSKPDAMLLFNGVDLNGWVDVYDSPGTWSVRDSMIVCTGQPYGMLRTMDMYENFVIELEWRHLAEGGNAGLFVVADALPAIGKPFARTIEAQILDGNHGDVFAMNGAEFLPDQVDSTRARRSLPTEQRVHPLGEWNHYRFESRDGTLKLSVNGEIVNGGSGAVPRKGYIALESEGSEVHFRNIRIVELPTTNPDPGEIALANPGFESIYGGLDLSGWTTDEAESWTPNGWRLQAAGAAESTLWSDRTGEDFELMVDWRLTGDSTGADVGGLVLGLDGRTSVLFGSAGTGSGTVKIADRNALAESRADRPAGQWNRMLVRLDSGMLSVVLNDIAVAAPVPVPAGTLRLGLVQLGTGAFEVGNLFLHTLR